MKKVKISKKGGEGKREGGGVIVEESDKETSKERMRNMNKARRVKNRQGKHRVRRR